MAGRAAAASPLLFADEDFLSFKIHVRHSAPKQFASLSTGVSREAKHRIDEGLQLLTSDVLQDLVDLGHGEKERIPECLLVSGRQSATADLAFDLLPGLEWWFLFRFREHQTLVRKRSRQKAGFHAPVPQGPKAG